MRELAQCYAVFYLYVVLLTIIRALQSVAEREPLYMIQAMAIYAGLALALFFRWLAAHSEMREEQERIRELENLIAIRDLPKHKSFQ